MIFDRKRGNALKAAIIFYSETGNTKRVAEFIQEGMEKSGAEVRLYNLKEEQPDADYVRECRCVLCGTPAYYANMCWQIKKWLDMTPNVLMAGKLGGAFATAGCVHGGGDVAVLTILQHLLVKGMVIYSSGAEYGRPVIHLGPVGIKSTTAKAAELEKQKDLFVLFGERFTHKATELFS